MPHQNPGGNGKTQDLIFEYKEQTLDDESMIDERMNTNQIKQIKVTCRNATPTAAVDLKIKSNLNADQYAAVIPESIPPGTTAVFMINLNARALWDDKLDGIGFEITYELTKTV